MTERTPGTERERAHASVAARGLELRRAQEELRQASAVLKRAVRNVDKAEAELGSAMRRLARTAQLPEPKDRERPMLRLHATPTWGEEYLETVDLGERATAAKDAPATPQHVAPPTHP